MIKVSIRVMQRTGFLGRRTAMVELESFLAPDEKEEIVLKSVDELRAAGYTVVVTYY